MSRKQSAGHAPPLPAGKKITTHGSTVNIHTTGSSVSNRQSLRGGTTGIAQERSASLRHLGGTLRAGTGFSPRDNANVLSAGTPTTQNEYLDDYHQ